MIQAPIFQNSPPVRPVLFLYNPLHIHSFSRVQANYVSVKTPLFSHKTSQIFSGCIQFLQLKPAAFQNLKKFLSKFHKVHFCMNFPPQAILSTSCFNRRIYAGESGNLRCEHRKTESAVPNADGQPAAAGKKRGCPCPAGADRREFAARALRNPAV